MKVRALRPFLGQEGTISAGQVFEVSELRARDLEARRPQLAVPLIDRAAVAALKGKETASEGTPRPTLTLPLGSQTIAAKPASLSPQAQAPQASKSRRRAARRGS